MRHDDRDEARALPLLIVDGRAFTWDQIGRMLMTFEGFTLNAIVEDSIEVVGGPLADGRLESQASSQSAPAVPAPVIRPGASNRQTAKRGMPTRSWPPSPRRLDALIEEATVDALPRIRAGNRLPDHTRRVSAASIWCDRPWRGRSRRED
jgi:hypothetical protein